MAATILMGPPADKASLYVVHAFIHLRVSI
jgi:hypothetical protein